MKRILVMVVLMIGAPTIAQADFVRGPVMPGVRWADVLL